MCFSGKYRRSEPGADALAQLDDSLQRRWGKPKAPCRHRETDLYSIPYMNLTAEVWNAVSSLGLTMLAWSVKPDVLCPGCSKMRRSPVLYGYGNEGNRYAPLHAPTTRLCPYQECRWPNSKGK